ncbi:hypothetical protein [Leptospira congkakensis]|uniref:hypothetical protein n=1 Tax=Leptospira congkakensis TaxID=2484932 RepID=UPI00142E5DD5|nr:hypothetical protein [Leptospira congkakensis]
MDNSQMAASSFALEQSFPMEGSQLKLNTDKTIKNKNLILNELLNELLKCFESM